MSVKVSEKHGVNHMVSICFCCGGTKEMQKLHIVE